MRTYKIRHQFYLPDDLSGKLEQLSSRPGASKTSIMTEAFRAWLDRRGGNELDQRFGHRLDKLSREHGSIHDRIDLLAEALGLFIQHQLTLVAHQPPFDEDTRSRGLERYRAFVEVTGRRLARANGQLRIAPRETDIGEQP